MVLTAAQVTHFFTSPLQMAIPAATIPALASEGIATPNDLAEFDSKDLQGIVETLRKPNDRVPNPDPNAPPGSTIPRPPYILGAKSQKRMVAASELMRYYRTTNRAITAGNIAWDPIVMNFVDQWKSLKDRKEEDIDVPKLSRGLPMLKWVEAFNVFLSRKIGVRNIPLAYVIREHVDVNAQAPALANNRPHSIEHGSVEEELVARASHDSAFYKEDNSKVYFLLEESLRGTSYAQSLKPFERYKEGRAALFSVIKQYAGKDKWKTELQRQDEFIHNRRWKGQNNFTLERFIAQHRNAFVSMTQCSAHVKFQLPDEYTRVGYLLEGIQTSDSKLQAAIAVVESDEVGKREDFEATASYLLPRDPVAARHRQATSKNPVADIAAIDASEEMMNASEETFETADVAAFGAKNGRGKTGVHLRYYRHDEYKTLTLEQKNELKEWRQSQNGGEKGKVAAGGKNKARISSSTVADEVQKQLKALTSEAHDADAGAKELESYILSVVDKRKPEAASVSDAKKARTAQSNNGATVSSSSSALTSILRRVKQS